MIYAVRSQRGRVLEAMVRVAAERGYEGVSVAEVIELAGVSRRTFDAHFVSKENCFLEAYDAAINIVVNQYAAAFERELDASWVERITAGLRALVELLAAEPDISRLALVDIAAVGEDARYRYGLALDRFLPFLEQGREETPNGAKLPAETARFALGGATNMIFEEIRAGRTALLPEILPDLIFASTMPYLGAEAARAAMKQV